MTSLNCALSPGKRHTAGPGQSFQDFRISFNWLFINILFFFRCTFLIVFLEKIATLQSPSIASLNDAKWCPVDGRRSYMSATQQRRNASQAKNFFMGLVRPHSSVTGSTVKKKWIKNQLSLASVDTSTFTVNSTWIPSASKAASIGVPFSQILKKANWASESTFSRYYCRDVPQPDLTAAILEF